MKHWVITILVVVLAVLGQMAWSLKYETLTPEVLHQLLLQQGYDPAVYEWYQPYPEWPGYYKIRARSATDY